MKTRNNHVMILFAAVFALCLVFLFTGCARDNVYKPIPGLDLEEKVEIRIAIPYETDKGLTFISNDFMSRYENVTVSIEYIENYEKNAAQKFEAGEYDIILMRDKVYSENTETDSETGAEKTSSTEDYYYNFYGDTDIDMTRTSDVISESYTHKRIDGNGNEVTYMYSLPLGGELRGLFVNKSLLDSLNLSIPTNYQEFLSCCETLKGNGFIPIQGNPSTAGRSIGLPDGFRNIVNDPESMEKLENVSDDVSELFVETFEKLHELASKRYYDYKYVEEQYKLFLNSNETAQCMNFLGLSFSETAQIIKPENNIGNAAFFPYSSSFISIINGFIENYGLDTEVVFICPPLNDEGENGAVYFTPYYGVCANKNSEDLIWLREFVNYLFANIKKYAEDSGINPNSSDGLELLAEKYNVDKDRDCVLAGKLNFVGKYNAYSPVSLGLVDVFKCSAPKYMVVFERDAEENIVYKLDGEGKEYLPLANEKQGTEEETKIYKEYVGNEDPANPGYAFCTVDYYLEKLEGYFANYRN